MKKLNKVAVLFASAAIAAPLAAFAQVSTGGDNWRSTDGTVWKNGTSELCWRDANWTPATAATGCDGAAKPAAAPAPAPAAAPAPAPAAVAPAPVAPAPAPVAPAPAAAPRAVVPVPVPVPAPAAPTSEKVSFAADAFFDTGKSVLKKDAQGSLDELVGKAKGVNLEVIIAVGHTDAVGSDASNQKLSVRRSEAVKSYLVKKGIDKNRVYTEGKGESAPVADNKTADGRAKNRRVEIEVVGTKDVKK
ncbi:MAG: hypothetical protein RLY78_767 [Pseudomonadota bacterium]|jgi:OOP family OmpA-OmpF porin